VFLSELPYLIHRVLNCIYESAGIVASAKDVRFDPVVVLVIAVADDKRWFAAAVDLSVP
jgi:hypothetical protein